MMNGNVKINGAIEISFNKLEVKVESKKTRIADSDISEEKVNIDGSIKIDGDLNVNGNIDLKAEIRDAICNMINGFANKGRNSGKHHRHNYATDTRK